MGDESNLHEQFCQDDVDISGSPYASQDADEARLWEYDVLVAAFTVENDVWSLDATDLGVAIWDAAEGKTWGTAREALTFAREWLATEG